MKKMTTCLWRRFREVWQESILRTIWISLTPNYAGATDNVGDVGPLVIEASRTSKVGSLLVSQARSYLSVAFSSKTDQDIHKPSSGNSKRSFEEVVQDSPGALAKRDNVANEFAQEAPPRRLLNPDQWRHQTL